MRKGDKGVAAVMAVCVMAALAGLATLILMVALGGNREASFNRQMTFATALAEGATEVATKSLLVAQANYQAAPTAGTATISGTNIPYSITPVGPQRNTTDSSGIVTMSQQYKVSARVVSNGYAKYIEKIISVNKTPIFQFVAFYNDDLEMLPGPTMNLMGRVFSNGNIYIGSNNSLQLATTFDRSAGHMYRYRKDGTAMASGSVSIEVNGSSPVSYSNMDVTFDSRSSNWATGALQLWNGTVESSEMGVTQIQTPSVQTTQLYAPTGTGTGGNYNLVNGNYVQVAAGTGAYNQGYFYDNAAVSIINGVAYDSNGNKITNWGQTTNPVTSTDPTIYDGRENKNVKVTEIDMSKLTTYLARLTTQNGLVYIARTDTTASQPNGVRLKNGSVLYSPITVVSPDPVYVKGDYNKGDSHNTQKPSAVIADSFNVLSNAWNDTKRAGTLPDATETTVNVAFITGNYDTTTGNYNGGFENLPRFHEDWDNVTMHMRGSFVDNWSNQYAKGQWIYGGDNYTAPNRDWNYDTNFNDVTKLPPFTPMVFGCARVVWKTNVPGISFGLAN